MGCCSSQSSKGGYHIQEVLISVPLYTVKPAQFEESIKDYLVNKEKTILTAELGKYFNQKSLRYEQVYSKISDLLLNKVESTYENRHLIMFYLFSFLSHSPTAQPSVGEEFLNLLKTINPLSKNLKIADLEYWLKLYYKFNLIELPAVIVQSISKENYEIDNYTLAELEDIVANKFSEANIEAEIQRLIGLLENNIQNNSNLEEEFVKLANTQIQFKNYEMINKFLDKFVK